MKTSTESNPNPKNLISNNEDYSSIDPSLVNDLLKSEESEGGRVKFVNPRHYQYEGEHENEENEEEEVHEEGKIY
jgi:hypothetical protein